jgi:hypothetical protein
VGEAAAEGARNLGTALSITLLGKASTGNGCCIPPVQTAWGPWPKTHFVISRLSHTLAYHTISSYLIRHTPACVAQPDATPSAAPALLDGRTAYPRGFLSVPSDTQRARARPCAFMSSNWTLTESYPVGLDPHWHLLDSPVLFSTEPAPISTFLASFVYRGADS